MVEALKEPKISSFFMGKFLQNFKMDKNKCPKTKRGNTFPKNMRCDHNLFLWSGHRKNNFQFVTINFFIF